MKSNLLSGKIVLVSPLNWGLGHVTRCVPIIEEIERLGAQVVLASSGNAKTLLETFFPHSDVLELPDYEVTYQKWGSLGLKLLFSIPRVLNIIKAEKEKVNKIVSEINPDLILSDNRYGVWNKTIPSVFITHQLNLQSPVFSDYFNKKHMALINNFNEVWVPDWQGASSFSGKLSTSNKYLEKKITYVGPLSALSVSANIEVSKDEEKRDYIAILSGPEPQRSILEFKLVRIFEKIQDKILIVRGVSGGSVEYRHHKNVEMVNYLIGSDLQKEVKKSRNILCRSGYSSIMDLIALGRSAILIPTSGQTEQEYLAKYHVSKQNFGCILQKDLTYQKIVNETAKFTNKYTHNNNLGVLRERLKSFFPSLCLV